MVRYTSILSMMKYLSSLLSYEFALSKHTQKKEKKGERTLYDVNYYFLFLKHNGVKFWLLIITGQGHPI